MTTDALAAMSAYDDAAYDQLLKDAEIDERVGNHSFTVTKVTRDKWPSGDPRNKFQGVLSTARNAKADLTLSPPPPAAEVAELSKEWEPGKKKAIAGAISLLRQLAKLYGKTLDDIQEGDTFRVKTVKTRRDADGTGGFIRVVAFLDPNAPDSSDAGGASSPGF